MQGFLEKICDHVLDNYQGETGDLCIVTPNRRAGLFLQKHFSSRVTRAMWAPEILGIEDFINAISGFSTGDQLGLLFGFYDVYAGLEKEKGDDFGTFFSWAPALLRDFDDIDSALADPGRLYDHLESIRFIDTWNPDGSEPTPLQKAYLSFIRKLRTYHGALTKQAEESGVAWQGLSTRKAAEMLSPGETELPWKKVVFAGFNALTQAEESIVKTLTSRGTAEFLTDSDPYYADDPTHEAGRFIRKYRGKFRSDLAPDPTEHFRDPDKKIHILGVPRNVHQALLAGNILQDAPGLPADEKTAVVLAGEELLIPMLNALPGNIDNVNVTMGYPLTKTTMFEFFDALFAMHMRAVSKPTEKGKTVRFHHPDTCRLLAHSNSSMLFGPEDGEDWGTRLIARIGQGNQRFHSFDELAGLSGNPGRFARSFGFLNSSWQEDTGKVLPACIALLEELDRLFREKAAKQGRDIVQTPYFADFESIYYFARLFRQLQGFLVRSQRHPALPDLHRIFRQSCAETRLSFTGEPLRGLQVMGMLETRSLDFDNIILLSANEDILPKAKNDYSFLPYEVKKAFGLRLYHDQDAIYAYHFYRLLQRAKNIYLVYNTQTQDFGSSEKSRFIAQLQHELPAYNPGIAIRESLVSLPPPTGMALPPPIIRKDGDVMEALHKMAERGFSPSSLGSYINCPLQFYLERVIRLEEAEEVEETMEARTIGNVVHRVLESLYSSLCGRVLQPGDIDRLQEKLPGALRDAFAGEYDGGDIRFGKNLLLYHLTERTLTAFLQREKEEVRKEMAQNRHISILSLEKPLRSDIVIRTTGGGKRPVAITGKADRIDQSGSTIRIIDYKTGKIDPHELTFPAWEVPFERSDKAKNFQLLCYAWLLYKSGDASGVIVPGIISLRQTKKWVQTMKHPGGKGSLSHEDLGAFEEHLGPLLGEILDPEVPFRQTTEEKNCRYCSFRETCRRF